MDFEAAMRAHRLSEATVLYAIYLAVRRNDHDEVTKLDRELRNLPPPFRRL